MLMLQLVSPHFRSSEALCVHCTVLFEILSALIAVLELCCYYNSSKTLIFYTGIIMPFAALNPVLPRRTYLFSAPVPHFILILAPAPAIYCNLKMYFNSSAVRNMSQLRLEVEISFSSSYCSILYTDCSKYKFDR